MIELVNETAGIVVVNDMGIELDVDEKLDVESTFTDKVIINSIDLVSSTLTIKQNNIPISYKMLIRYIKKINHYDHLNVDSHSHNILDDAFFDVEKVNDITSKITYYTNSSKTNIIREEKIIRNATGVVVETVSIIYNSDGEIEETETQTLNRNVEGTVDNISIEIH